MYYREIKCIDGIAHVDVDDGERKRLTWAAGEVAAAVSEKPDLLNFLAGAQQLPASLLDLLAEAVPIWPPVYSGWLLRGLPVDAENLGATPDSWRHGIRPPTPEDCQLLMVGSALGTVFAWADQQAGSPVHNIVPVAGEEKSLLSSSSSAPLALHTEDAFFDERADFVVLFCLRNPSGAATYIADVRNIELSEEQRQLVQSDRYYFESDASHDQGGERSPARGFPVVDRAASPTVAGPTALMSAAASDPWLRLDIDYVKSRDDPAATDAMHALERKLQDARAELVLQPGDLMIIDNRCTVHGRGRFLTDYSGGDRWLKRVNVATRGRSGIPPRPPLPGDAIDIWHRAFLSCGSGQPAARQTQAANPAALS
jgi:alpha-ketoglutarate-dependent taurine dioxygenase